MTGFFRIHDHDSNPLHVGSTGASVALGDGVTTRVILRKGVSSRVRASFNGHILSAKSVSAYVATRYLELDGRRWSVNISHASRFPMGRGYGTSGAGALGLSLALNHVMGLSLKSVEAAQIAHVSEVVCKAGLGTVSSAFSGGMTLRTEPGAPGVGRTSDVPISRSNVIVTSSFAPISTRRALGSIDLRNRIDSCANDLVNTLRQHKTYSSFMRLSRTFAECLGLFSRNLKRLIYMLDSIGIESSMAMLGQTAFCIVPFDEAMSIADKIRKEGSRPIITEVAQTGARLE